MMTHLYDPALLGTFDIVSLIPTLVESIKYFYFRRFNNYRIVFISEIVIQNLLVLEISETMKTHPSQLHWTAWVSRNLKVCLWSEFVNQFKTLEMM